MPFLSKAQQGAAFGGYLGPEMKAKASQWAAETPNMKSLPQHVKHRAFGGPVQAGRPYMVGERGPEMMVPRMPGTVMPHMGTAAVSPVQQMQHRALVNHFIRQGLKPHGL